MNYFSYWSVKLLLIFIFSLLLAIIAHILIFYLNKQDKLRDERHDKALKAYLEANLDYRDRQYFIFDED